MQIIKTVQEPDCIEPQGSEAAILVVQYDHYSMTALQVMFRQYGFSFDRAIDGAEAIERIMDRHHEKKPAFKLILVDLELPRVGGLEIATQIVHFFSLIED